MRRLAERPVAGWLADNRRQQNLFAAVIFVGVRGYPKVGPG